MAREKSLLYWHIKTFEEYIKDDLNPLGLQVQIFRSFENIDPVFKTAWESNLKACSTGMIKLRLTDIDDNINTIYSKIQLLQTQSSRLFLLKKNLNL